MRTLRVLSLFVVLASTSLFGQPEVPQLQQRVTDFTNTLSFNEWRSLENQLKRFEDSTSTQIAILMINSLEGASIDDYSMQVFEKNKLGQKGKDNGVLILIAKADHKARIEVGYGLESVLTDAATTQIREREMNPFFRANNFYGGLSAGVSAIIATTAGQYKVEGGRNAPMMSFILVLFFFGIMGAFVIPMFSTRRRAILTSGGSTYRSGWGWPYGGFGGGSGGGFFSGGSFGGGGFSGGGGMGGGGGSSGSW